MNIFHFSDVIGDKQVWWVSISLQSNKVIVIGQFFLFKIRKNCQKLNEEQADAFHHMVYQLLFAANWAQCDIQTAVSFLTTCVQKPDEDDWGKLKQILKYLNGTQHLKLMLRADQLKLTVHRYVDGSHLIYKDCRGYTGSLITFG